MPDDSKLQSMALRGNSRITGAAGASGGEGMSARDIDLTYAPDGRTLQTAKLVENAVAQIRGGGGARQVSAATSISRWVPTARRSPASMPMRT